MRRRRTIPSGWGSSSPAATGRADGRLLSAFAALVALSIATLAVALPVYVGVVTAAVGYVAAVALIARSTRDGDLRGALAWRPGRKPTSECVSFHRTAQPMVNGMPTRHDRGPPQSAAGRPTRRKLAHDMTPSIDSPFDRTDETFVSEGTTCAAWVYRPRSFDGRDVPVVVMAHGLSGVRNVGLLAYAERFAAAGYGVVVFDYRSFGESGGEPRQMVSAVRQVQDYRAALTFARGLTGMDSTKVIAWGTSFAGGHVLTLAADGEPLAAVISQVPFISGIAAMRSMGFRKVAQMTGPGVRDALRGLTRRSPLYIPSVGSPGDMAVMTSPDAAAGHERIVLSSGHKLDDYSVDVAARFVLTFPTYAPGRGARRVQCPALVQIAENDVVTPTGVAVRAAKSIPDSTVRTYPGGHFDLYVDPLFASVVADQLEFLLARVPTPAAR